jgi:hypothetical protein
MHQSGSAAEAAKVWAAVDLHRLWSAVAGIWSANSNTHSRAESAVAVGRLWYAVCDVETLWAVAVVEIWYALLLLKCDVLFLLLNIRIAVVVVTEIWYFDVCCCRCWNLVSCCCWGKSGKACLACRSLQQIFKVSDTSASANCEKMFKNARTVKSKNFYTILNLENLNHTRNNVQVFGNKMNIFVTNNIFLTVQSISVPDVEFSTNFFSFLKSDFSEAQ